MSHDIKRFKGEASSQRHTSGGSDEENEHDTLPSLPDSRVLKEMEQPIPLRRKFDAQPIETTKRSSEDGPRKQDNEDQVSHSPKPSPGRRRFAPEVVSTASRIHKPVTSPGAANGNAHNDSPKASPARRKFAVEPISTSTRSNRETHHSPQDTSAASKAAPSPRPKRRFKVEMIETATRSRKSGDTSPAVRAEDKTNGTHSESFKSTRPSLNSLQPPSASSANTSHEVPFAQLLKPNPNRQGSMHPHHTTRANTRQHSFKVPSLEAINSSGSSTDSLRSRRSHSSSLSSNDEGYKDATRMRESVDERFSGYLLALAARAAEKQLREQEAAVFPAPDSHEPIMHYVDSEGSTTSSPEPSRKPTEILRPTATRYRQDSEDEHAALQAMRRHGEEQVDKAGQKDQTQPAQRRTGGFNVEFDAEAAQGAWMANALPAKNPPVAKANNVIGGYQRDPDLKQMRKAASPPMLGGDIDFPRCPSPEHARFDVTQGSEFLKHSMCYLSNSEDAQGLWGGVDRKASANSQTSNKSAESPGLWGGHCTANDIKPSSVAVGIVTPQRSPIYEKRDPFRSLSSGSAAGTSVAGKRGAPPTPPPSHSGGSNASVNITVSTSQTQQEAVLEDEFPDSFVTQVYNYLSLGFPALATKFDPELSKVTGVDISELRKDDKLAEQRGYLRLGEDEVDVHTPLVARNKTEKGMQDGEDAYMEDAAVEPVKEEMCARWRALRIYVREWGRQMGVANKDGRDPKYLNPHRAWGLPARKGSWGG
ncbi:MAG: hypothetical protein Q9159_006369 [Coniocarpon cinnabarinum]